MWKHNLTIFFLLIEGYQQNLINLPILIDKKTWASLFNVAMWIAVWGSSQCIFYFGCCLLMKRRGVVYEIFTMEFVSKYIESQFRTSQHRWIYFIPLTSGKGWALKMWKRSKHQLNHYVFFVSYIFNERWSQYGKW